MSSMTNKFFEVSLQYKKLLSPKSFPVGVNAFSSVTHSGVFGVPSSYKRETSDITCSVHSDV